MEPKLYTVSKIEGEYATLIAENGDDLFIAMALLPLGVDIGTKLLYDFPEFTVVG